MEDIKAKVQAAAATNAPSIEISEADFAAFAKGEKSKQQQSELQASNRVEVPPKVKEDVVLKVSEHDGAKTVGEMLDETESHLSDLDELVSGSTDAVPMVDITYADKQAFITALTSDQRFRLPFSIFNGAISGIFRSRLQAESMAIFAQLDFERRTGRLEMHVSQSLRLRNMLLATQIEILNNEEYLELKKPYMPVIAAFSRKEEPGWLDQVQIWENKPEMVVRALYDALKEFEYKYLTMLEHATDQNFWKTATYS